MGLTIGIAGASGGLGASTLAATLAARSHCVLDDCGLSVAVDLDPRGGLETTMCLEHLEGARWPEVMAADWAGADIAAAVHPAALPGADQVHVLSGSRLQDPDRKLVAEVLDLLSACSDLVVVDCGPLPEPDVLSRLDLLVVLARTTARGAADLASLVEGCRLPLTSPVLVTRAPGRDRRGTLLAREVRVPFLAHLPDDPTVHRHEREGVPPGVLRSAPDLIADEVLTVAQAAGPGVRVREVEPGFDARSA